MRAARGLRSAMWAASMDGMSGTSTDGPRKPLIPKERQRQALRKRVGAYLRARRQELGLTQGEITKALGYVSLNSVSNLETGREGLPAKRIYAWADILQVPRDAFFRFVTGESDAMDAGKASAAPEGERMRQAEATLLATYRRLPAKYQRRLRESASEFETLARAESRRKS
jgi:transcriptional regulator with XRE-family HTH domain